MRICIFGASGQNLAQAYFEAAEELGRLLAQKGHTLVFGGGAKGLMGACARGAAAGGCEIIGVAPRFFDEPGVLFGSCSRFVYTDTMGERKAAMVEMSDAFLVLPGGIGTFEEFFEVLTLKQLGQHAKPISLLNTLGYYDDLQKLLEKAAEGAFLSRSALLLYHLCDTPEQALSAIEQDVPMTGNSRRLIDYAK